MNQHLSPSSRHRPSTLGSASTSCALAALSLAAISLPACQGAETHELGYTQVPLDLTNEPTPAPEPEPTEAFYTSQADFVGRWVGEALDPLSLGATESSPHVYEFPSGSTQFVIEIVALDNSNGGSGLGGTLTFGEGTPPAPATDPNKGYPVGFDYSALSYDTEVVPGFEVNYEFGMPPFEGFPYTLASAEITGSSVPDGIVRMVYTTSEYVGSWCELQTPVAWPDGSLHVLPFAPGGFESLNDGTEQSCNLYGENDTSNCPEGFEDLPPEESFEVFLGCFEQVTIATLSCDKIYVSNFCDCEDGTCGAGYGDNGKRLMLRADGDELVGVFENALFRNPRGLSTAIGEVRFHRVAE